MVRAKFMVTRVSRRSWDSGRGADITLEPQYDSTIEEDRRYAQATPSGRMEMSVDNPKAIEALALGKTCYVDFTPVD
jgi:hypothetical protein